MSIFLLITRAYALFDLIGLIQFRKRKRDKKKEFIWWGLGVDCCYFYSRPFAITNQCITLNGYQEVVDSKSAICYSLVKMNWWGKRNVYCHNHIFGNYKDSNSFQIVMKNIPNGENYKIEVYNGVKMSFGQFQIKETSDIQLTNALK
jgi:hypothetical protein